MILRSYQHTIGNIILLVTLVVVTGSVSLLACVPPVSRDALTHHLAVPKLYLQHGGIFEIPYLEFSYYPMNLDLLYMVPLALGNDIIPKFLHFLFALLTAWLIFTYLRKRLNRSYGLVGCLVFLSIPVIVKLSITVYVDLGLIFFTTASMMMLFRWIEDKCRLRFLLMAAISCGLAVGTKYNGLISLFLLSAFIPILYSRSATVKTSAMSGLQYGVIFIVISVAVASPWLIRNYIWTHNPLFPLFDTLFNPDNQNISTGGIGIFLLRHLIYDETPLQILLVPIRIFFEGQDNSPQYFDGKLNPFLLILPLLAFISSKHSAIVHLEKKAMLSFCILFLLFALFQVDMRIRYIAPMIPFLAILSTFGLHSMVTSAQQHNQPLIKRSKYILPLLLFLAMLSYNGRYLVEQFRIVQPGTYLKGEVSREDYITNFRPEYPVIQYANIQLQGDSKVLCLFMGKRGYYMDFEHVFDVPLAKNSRFNTLVSTISTPEELHIALHKTQFTHLFVRDDLTRKWLVEHDKQRGEILAFFFQHALDLMYTENGYTLFRLKNEYSLD